LVDVLSRGKYLWESTFDAIQDPVSLLDPHLRIQRANLAMAARVGVDIREMIGKHCYEIFAGRSSPCEGCPAAEAMRRILIDRARQKRALRHGGGQQRVELELVDLPFPGDDDQLLAVNEALDKLAVAHPADAEVVKLRYFVGMTNEEAADALGISPRTATHYWAHARAWLFQEISPA
jgi:PAS domain-containing protein